MQALAPIWTTLNPVRPWRAESRKARPLRRPLLYILIRMFKFCQLKITNENVIENKFYYHFFDYNYVLLTFKTIYTNVSYKLIEKTKIALIIVKF